MKTQERNQVNTAIGVRVNALVIRVLAFSRKSLLFIKLNMMLFGGLFLFFKKHKGTIQ